MLRKFMALSTVAAVAMATPALANDEKNYDPSEETVTQTVLMTGEGFFPEVTYAKPGYSLVFHNDSEGSIVIKAADGSWETDDIPASGSATVKLASDMNQQFVVDGSETVAGAFSFLPAPTRD